MQNWTRPQRYQWKWKIDSNVLTWHEPTFLLALWTWSLPHACTRTEWMKITNCNPARVATDFFYEPHGWLEHLFMRAREATYFHYNKRPCEQQITLLILGHSQPPHNVVATLIISNKHMYCTLPWKLTTEPKVHHQLPCLNAPDQSSKNAQLSHQNRPKVNSTDQNT